jgi:DNA-binding NtrC family response regulator
MYTSKQLLGSPAKSFPQREEQSPACSTRIVEPEPDLLDCDLWEQAISYERRALVGRALGEVERDLILDTLKHCVGNRTHAANILGISIRTLRNKLHKYAGAGLLIPPPRLNREEISRQSSEDRKRF